MACSLQVESVTRFDRALSGLQTDLLLGECECEVRMDGKMKCLQLGKANIDH